MSFKAKFNLLLLTLACWGAGAHATDFFCNNHYVTVALSGAVPIFQCVQTAVGPGAPVIVGSGFDQAGAGKIAAASTSTGSGFEASASTAAMSASPGALSGDVSASMLSGSAANAQAVGKGDAWFYDIATVVAASGVPTGTPAKLRVTLTLDCACAGGAINQPLSEAKIEEFFVGNFVSSTGIANKINPGFVQVFNHDVLTGDTFRVIAKLHLQSGASNDTVSTAAGSRGIASAQVYIDVLSGNASVTGDSGHLYATPVVTGTTPQSLTFGALTGKVLGDAPFDVSATASSGLPVIISSLTGSVCTVAGVSVTLIATGTCTIRVSQAGNGTFAPAADVDQSFAVSASSSAVSITNSPAQPITGQAITFAVTITGSSPGGTVTFTDNGGTIGTSSVTNGSASLTVPSLSQGNHSIVAQYSGDANNLAANSAPLGFTVQAAPTTSSSSGGGGCTARTANFGTDLLMPLMAFISLGWIVVRKKTGSR